MRKIDIIVNGTEYGCHPTMGAMLRFKKETGKEITEIDPKSFTDLFTYLYCCAMSCAKVEGKDFPFESPIDFGDYITQEQAMAWFNAVAEDSDAEAEEMSESEKKKA